MKRPEIIKRLADILQQVAPDSTRILFGSEARGDARPDSDIDVFVSPLVVLRSFWERMETPFTCNVEKEGIVL